MPAAGLEEVQQQIPLLFPVDLDDALADRFCSGVARCDIDRLGLVEQPSSQLTYLRREGSGEEQVCRFAGSRAMIFLMSRMKPMSSMRSASSSTKTSIAERSTVCCCT